MRINFDFASLPSTSRTVFENDFVKKSDDDIKVKSPSTNHQTTNMHSTIEKEAPTLDHFQNRRRRVFGQNFGYFNNYFYIFLFILLSLSTLLISTASSDEIHAFLAEPNTEPYYVKENDVGPLIYCEIADAFRNRTRYELEWMKIVSGFPITVSRNSELFDRKSYDLEENIKSGKYNLRIKSVNLKHDNGNFFCKLIDLEDRQRQHVSKPAKIVVVVPPQPPTIISEPVEAVRENDLIAIACASTGGNPAPKMTWIFDNDTRVPDAWSQERQQYETGQTISTLKWHVKSDDNGAYLTCQVWNEAMHEAEILSVETNRLNVNYAPRVVAGPLSVLNVEDGQTVELICHADANPKALQFEWKHTLSGKTHPEEQWQLVAERHLSGDYWCTAMNAIASASGKLEINVLYAPQIKIRSVGNIGVNENNPLQKVVEPTEGDELVLECEVEANPIADQVWWTGSNGSFIQNGSRLVISHIQRSDIGNFTCFASNKFINLYSPSLAGGQSLALSSKPEFRMGQSSVYVDVKRKPGAAIISADKNVVEIGERLVLTCTTGDFGNPSAKFRWETPNGLVSSRAEDFLNSRELIIEEAKLADNGRYKCIPYNQLGQGKEAQIKILVIHPARITRAQKPKHLLTAGDTDIFLHCEAQGYPQPKFEWFKDGVLIENANAESSNKLHSHWLIQEREAKADCEKDEVCVRITVSSLHFFDTVQWLDKGNYTCRTFNSPVVKTIGSLFDDEEVLASSTQVSVVHEPVIQNERFDNIGLSAADVGTTARIVCLVSARPEPTINWLRDGQEITVEDLPHYRAHASRLYNKLDEFESTLELKNIKESDYGAYTCVARNGAGGQKAVLEIRLQSKSRPQTSKLARLLKSSTTWLMVGWKAGFDGGDSQEFEVQYRVVDPYSGKSSSTNSISDDDSVTTFVFDNNNSTSMTFYGLGNDYETSDSLPAMQRRKRFSSNIALSETFLVHNLTRLRPMSNLLYRVRSRNILGYSDWTSLTAISTMDALEIGTDYLSAPESVQYFFDEKKLIVHKFKSSVAPFLSLENTNKNAKESNKSSNICILVYVLPQSTNSWRSVGCFPQAPASTIPGSPLENAFVIPGIRPAERYKVRFCQKSDLNVCSIPAEVFVDITAMSMAPSWESLLLVGVLAILFIVVMISTLYCCRRFFLLGHLSSASTTTTSTTSTSTNKKKLKKRLNLNGAVIVDKYDTGSQLPPSDHKNTVVHGSQNDSGVFTLASTTNAANHHNGTNNEVGSNSTNGDNWRQNSSNHSSEHSPFDFATDPYLQEFHTLHGIVAMENGLAADELNDSQQNYASIFRPAQSQNRRASLSSTNIHGVVHVGNGGLHSESEENGMPGGAILVGMGGGSSAVNSNEKLIVTAADGSDSASSYNGGGSHSSCRVMREIIV